MAIFMRTRRSTSREDRAHFYIQSVAVNACLPRSLCTENLFKEQCPTRTTGSNNSFHSSALSMIVLLHHGSSTPEKHLGYSPSPPSSFSFPRHQTVPVMSSTHPQILNTHDRGPSGPSRPTTAPRRPALNGTNLSSRPQTHTYTSTSSPSPARQEDREPSLRVEPKTKTTYTHQP